MRLGIFTRRGYSELVRHHYGSGWAWVLAAGLVVAVAGSMTTEFAAVAGIGELYGASRNLTLPMAAATLLIIVLSGSYRRVERTAILIGALELAFLMVAVMTHPDLGAIAHQVSELPLGNNGFWLLAAALIGAVFNPWMVFYQQSATAEKRLDHRHYGAARANTALGAVLTQVVSASVLFVAAATLGTGDAGASLASVGQNSEALIPHLGVALGRLVFSLGVLGASIVALFASAGLGARRSGGPLPDTRDPAVSRTLVLRRLRRVRTRRSSVRTGDPEPGLADCPGADRQCILAADGRDFSGGPSLFELAAPSAAPRLVSGPRRHRRDAHMRLRHIRCDSRSAVARMPVPGLTQPMLISLIHLVQKSILEDVGNGSHDQYQLGHRDEERRARNAGAACRSAEGGGRSRARHHADHVANDLQRLLRTGLRARLRHGLRCPITAAGQPGHARVPRWQQSGHGRTQPELTYGRSCYVVAGSRGSDHV